MPSVFAWLDSSEHERRRMLEVIDLFQQKGTVDELGLGGIRDAIADVLSPGTSTIQTRARYFFFLPWIFLDLERRRTPADKVRQRARDRELDLIPALAQADDHEGTIGIDAGRGLQRLPSAIYWAGLGRLGFRQYSGSLHQYFRSFGSRPPLAVDTFGDAESHANVSSNWSPHIPPPPADFPQVATFHLTRAEAEYFRERLQTHAAKSLLLFLVENTRSEEIAEFPWKHPRHLEMPDSLRDWLVHAQCFSELMHGAQLLYNLMLAERLPSEERIAEYRDWLGGWADQCHSNAALYAEWQRPLFWDRVGRLNPRLAAAARAFASQWIDLVFNASHPRALVDSPAARALVEQRERRLKRERSRLASRPHLELWGGQSGVDQLDYRWGITQRIASEILQGLGR